MISRPPDSPAWTGPPAAASGGQEPADLQPGVRRDEQEGQAVSRAEAEEEEANLTSTPDKAPCGLAPLQLSQLRTKNTDSFDMEEVRFQLSPPPCPLCSVIFSTRIPPPTWQDEQFFPESQSCVIFTDVAPFLKNKSIFTLFFKLFYYIYILRTWIIFICFFPLRFKVMKTRLYHTNLPELPVSTSGSRNLSA